MNENRQTGLKAHTGMWYFGTNTKMSMTDREALAYLEQLKDQLKDWQDAHTHAFVIPSFTVLSRAADVLRDSRIHIGAQNMAYEDKGQFTGEISPLSLKDIGVSIIEIGHSERRHIFGESCEDTRRKVKKALEHGFIPLLCVGETKEEKDCGISDEVLAIQIKTAFYGLSEDAVGRCLIAYEPVWAIGVNGTPADPEYVDARHKEIKMVLTGLLGPQAGRAIPVIYGGSVNRDNVRQLAACKYVDGLFVGRAAWTAASYAELLLESSAVYRARLAEDS